MRSILEKLLPPEASSIGIVSEGEAQGWCEAASRGASSISFTRKCRCRQLWAKLPPESPSESVRSLLKGYTAVSLPVFTHVGLGLDDAHPCQNFQADKGNPAWPRR